MWTVTCSGLYTPACTEQPYLTSSLPLALPSLCPVLGCRMSTNMQLVVPQWSHLTLSQSYSNLDP